jgi:Rrf2 family iron-sulfur cluster assembly transcriptional regulator
MSVFFSRQCEYAIQSVIYLAQKKDGQLTTIKEISSHLKIPFHFLGKIFQKLSRKRLLHSMKGVSGGFRLAKPSNEIVLMDIILAVDGPDVVNLCVLGYKECSITEPCPMHNEWKETKETFFAAMGKKNIRDIGKNMKKEGYIGR